MLYFPIILLKQQEQIKEATSNCEAASLHGCSTSSCNLSTNTETVGI